MPYQYPADIQRARFLAAPIPRDPKPQVIALTSRSSQDTQNRNQVIVGSCEVTRLVVELPDKTTSGWEGTEAGFGLLPAMIPPAHASRLCVTPGVGVMRIKATFKGHKHITGVALEIFRVDDAAAIWTKEFQWTAGSCPQMLDTGFDGDLNDDIRHHDVDTAHTITITPHLDAQAFPDGYLTVASPLYLLRARITSVSGGYRKVPARVTLLEVRVKDITLDWAPVGDRDLVPQARPDVTVPFQADTFAHEAALVGALAANAIAGNHEVLLDANYFTTNLDAEGVTAVDFIYNTHRDRWGDGPRIPLVAKVTVCDVHDQAVDAPLGLGGAKFLWDWEERAGVVKHNAWLQGNIPAPIKDFVKDALDCLVEAEAEAGEAPVGSNNTHYIHGGKRGRGGARVFPDQTGGTYTRNSAAKIANEFPFVVDQCANRRWAATSEARTRGFLAGHTGVIFQPSRIAGDVYKVSVYFLPGDDFPFDTSSAGLPKTPAYPMDESGYFEVWRTLNIKYFMRTAAVTPINTAAFEDTYKDAGFKLLGLAAPVDLCNEAHWVNSMPVAWLDVTTNGMTSTFNYTPLHAHANMPQPANCTEALNYKPIPMVLTATSFEMPKLTLLATRFAEETARLYTAAAHANYKGVTLFSFGKKHTHILGEVSSSGGTASATATRDRSNLFMYSDPAAVIPNPTKYHPHNTTKGYEPVVAHEIAHTITLMHSPGYADTYADQHQVWWNARTVGNSDANAVCVMNYHPLSEHFCGVCILRLRGWNAFVPKPDPNLVPLKTGESNKKKFRVVSVTADIPATPPKTQRNFRGGIDNASLIQRTPKVGRNETDLTSNPPVVLLCNGWETAPAPRNSVPLDALLKPFTLTAVIEMPNGATAVWKVVRAADDGAMVINASPNPLPTIVPDPMNPLCATLHPNAVGTFHVKVSVDLNGGTNFDDAAEFGCVNVVLVGVTRVKSNHAIKTRSAKVWRNGNNMEITTRPPNKEYPVILKTTVQLMGGGAQGQRGLDKVHGGWINTIRTDRSVSYYQDTNNNDWRGRAIYITRVVHNGPFLPLILGPHTPLRDSGANRVWLSETNPGPDPTAPLGASPRTRVRNSGGAEVQIIAKDAPSTGWDLHPPAPGGAAFDICRVEMDIRFCAYLSFCTVDAMQLFAVCEEVPWCALGDYDVTLAGPRRKRVAMKVATDGAKVKHVNLVPASTAGVEVARPGTGEVLQARNDDNTPAGTNWTTGLP